MTDPSPVPAAVEQSAVVKKALAACHDCGRDFPFVCMPGCPNATYRGADAFSALSHVLTVSEARSPDVEAQKLVALTLGYCAQTCTPLGDTVPQDVWEQLHNEGLLQLRFDFAGEGQSTITDKGYEELRAALASFEESQ